MTWVAVLLALMACPWPVHAQTGQDERTREASRKDTNVLVREAQGREQAGMTPADIADFLKAGLFETQQAREQTILQNVLAGDEIASVPGVGAPLLDQAVEYYRKALSEAEQQKPPHRPANMAWCRYRLACGVRQRALTRYWGDAARQADLTEAKALFESIVTDFPTSREAPHGYVPRGQIEIDLLGPPASVAPLDAKAARDRADAIYERLRMDYPEFRLWGEDAITGTAHTVPPEATVDDEVVYHLKNRAWARTYGITGENYANSIQPTIDGGYILAGTCFPFTPAYGQFWVLKLNRDGEVAWQKAFGGSTVNGTGFSIQPTADGGYVVAGQTFSFGAGGVDAWILKLQSDGSIAWQKAYGGGGADSVHSIVQTTDGGYVTAGLTTSFGAGAEDVWVLRLKGDGSLAWQKTYGGAGQDYANLIRQSSDGGFLVGAHTLSFGVGDKDTWILKLSGDGTVAWQKTYGGAGQDAAELIQPTSDGGCVIAGDAYSFGAGGVDTWVLKLDGEGTIAWQKVYGGTADDGPYSIQVTGDGGYVVAGGTRSFGAGGMDLWILKLKDSGVVEWQKTYGAAGHDQATSIQGTPDGGYIVGGMGTFGTAGSNLWFLKLNPDGTSVPAGMPSPPGMAVDSSATVQDTHVVGVDSTATVKDTAAWVANTAATVTDTNATVCQQAPQTWSPPSR